MMWQCTAIILTLLVSAMAQERSQPPTLVVVRAERLLDVRAGKLLDRQDVVDGLGKPA